MRSTNNRVDDHFFRVVTPREIHDEQNDSGKKISSRRKLLTFMQKRRKSTNEFNFSQAFSNKTTAGASCHLIDIRQYSQKDSKAAELFQKMSIEDLNEKLKSHQKSTQSYNDLKLGDLCRNFYNPKDHQKQAVPLDDLQKGWKQVLEAPYGKTVQTFRSEYLTLDYMLERVKTQNWALDYAKEAKIGVCGEIDAIKAVRKAVKNRNAELAWSMGSKDGTNNGKTCNGKGVIALGREQRYTIQADNGSQQMVEIETRRVLVDAPEEQDDDEFETELNLICIQEQQKESSDQCIDRVKQWKAKLQERSPNTPIILIYIRAKQDVKQSKQTQEMKQFDALELRKTFIVNPYVEEDRYLVFKESVQAIMLDKYGVDSANISSQKLDIRGLMIYGLVHCKGEHPSKTVIFESLAKTLDSVSFHDSKKKLALQLVFLAATLSEIKIAQLIKTNSQSTDMILRSEDIRKIGVCSRYLVDQMFTKNSQNCSLPNWVFNATEIRQRIFSPQIFLLVKLKERVNKIKLDYPKKMEHLKRILEPTKLYQQQKNKEAIFSIFASKLDKYQAISAEYGYDRTDADELISMLDMTRRERFFPNKRSYKLKDMLDRHQSFQKKIQGMRDLLKNFRDAESRAIKKVDHLQQQLDESRFRNSSMSTNTDLSGDQQQIMKSQTKVLKRSSSSTILKLDDMLRHHEESRKEAEAASKEAREFEASLQLPQPLTHLERIRKLISMLSYAELLTLLIVSPQGTFKPEYLSKNYDCQELHMLLNLINNCGDERLFKDILISAVSAQQERKSQVLKRLEQFFVNTVDLEQKNQLLLDIAGDHNLQLKQLWIKTLTLSELQDMLLNINCDDDNTTEFKFELLSMCNPGHRANLMQFLSENEKRMFFSLNFFEMETIVSEDIFVDEPPSEDMKEQQLEDSSIITESDFSVAHSGRNLSALDQSNSAIQSRQSTIRQTQTTQQVSDVGSDFVHITLMKTQPSYQRKIGERNSHILTYQETKLRDTVRRVQFDGLNELPKFAIDYPMLCYLNPQENEVILVNLADTDQSQKSFGYDDELQFVAFLGLDGGAVESRIAFLAKEPANAQKLFMVLIKHDQSFLKEGDNELANWTVEKKALDPSIFDQDLLLADQIQIRQAFYLQAIGLRKDTMPVSILYTTDSSIFLNKTDILNNQNENAAAAMEGEQELDKIELLRGYSNVFYFVVLDKQPQAHTVEELRLEINEDSNQWTYRKRTVWQGASGRIVAMELDPNSSQETDTYWSLDDKLMERKKPIANQLFVIDQQPCLVKLRQTEEQEGYEVLLRVNLSNIERLKKKLEYLASKPFARACISDRCLTIQGKTFIYSTGHIYDSLTELLINKDDDTIIESVSALSGDYNVHTVRKRSTRKTYCILKVRPGSRKCCLLGQKNRRDVLQISFVSQQTLLLKMRASRTQKNYWTLMDVSGQVLVLPDDLNCILMSEDWTILSTQLMKKDGYNLILLKSRTKLTALQFNQNGSLVGSHMFELGGVNTNPFYFSNNQSHSATKLISTFLASFTGQLYQVTVREPDSESQQIMMHETKLSENGNMQMINLTLYEKLSPDAQFVVCGRFLCWQTESTSRTIQVLDINKFMTKHSNTGTLFSYKKMIKQIDLAPLITSSKCQVALWIEPCSPLFALHASTTTRELDPDILEEKSNYLQVTNQNRAVIYDLCSIDDKGRCPAIREISALDQLLDPQKYVEIGVSIQTISALQRYSLQRKIEANSSASYYFLRQTARYQSLNGGAENSNMRTQDSHSPFLGLYRTYNELDLVEMRRIQSINDQNKKFKTVDVNALYSSFAGQSLFSYFEGDLKLYQIIYTVLEAKNLSNIEDTDESEVEHPDLRRLAQILRQKQYYAGNFCSIIQRNLLNVEVRDTLFKIASLCQSFSFCDILAGPEDFDAMTSRATPKVTDVLNSGLNETKSTRQITTIQWPKDQSILTYRSSSCIITAEELKNEITRINQNNFGTRQTDLMTKAITVRMLDLTWLFKDKAKFLRLTKILNKKKNKSIFTTQFVSNVLDQFWDVYYKRLLRRQLMPYLTYMLLSLYYMHKALEDEDPATFQNKIIFGSITLGFWFYQAFYECNQFLMAESKMRHFSSLWNVNDLVGLALILCIVLTSMLEKSWIPIQKLRMLASIASCSQILKAYDWMRLFEGTAFYILLISETIKDIRAFVILLIVGLMLFGVPLFMLNMNHGEHQPVIEQNVESWVINLLLNQYYMAIGLYNVASFSEQPDANLCFLFFVLAAFFTQILMLNMLIANMGDTFERVIENRDLHAVETKLQLMGDLASNIQSSRTSDKDSHDGRKVFLFVVTPDENLQDNLEDWEGSIKQMSKLSAQRMQQIETNLQRQISRLQEQIESSSQRDIAQDRDLKQQVYQMMRSSSEKSEKRMQALEEQVTSLSTEVRQALAILLSSGNHAGSITNQTSSPLQQPEEGL